MNTIQQKSRYLDLQNNSQIDTYDQRPYINQMISSSSQLDLKDIQKLKRFKSFSNQKSLHQNNDERYYSPQKQMIQSLKRQQSPLQQMRSIQQEHTQQFYSKKGSMEEFHSNNKTEMIDKKYKAENTKNYQQENSNCRSIYNLGNNSPVKIDKSLVKQDIDLPKLKSESQNTEEQQKSPLSKKNQRCDNQQDLGFKFIRERHKNSSLIESNFQGYIKRSQNSSRHLSPSIQDFQNIKHSKIQLYQVTDRVNNSNTKDTAKYSLNSSILLNQPQNKMIGISSVIQGLTQNLNQNEIQKQQSYIQLQLSTNRSIRKSMSQLRSNKKVESPEKQNENSQLDKSDYETTPFNYNYTQKRKSKLGNINLLGKLDSNIFPMQQTFKINLQQEEQKSQNDFSPQVLNKNDNNSDHNSPIFKIRKRLNSQEHGQFSNCIQQNFFSNLKKVQVDQDLTPQSLNELDNSSPLLKQENKNKQPNQISSMELIAAYNQDDRKVQKQILLRQEIQKIAEKAIPRFIKLCIEKNPDCQELMIICNQGMTIEKFCDKLGKLVTYCINNQSVKITSFNQIKLSLSLSEQILIFLQQFFLENNLNFQFFEEFSQKFRNMQMQLSQKQINLFQELGGKRRIEYIVEAIIKKLDKTYNLQLQTKLSSIIDFSLNLLTVNSVAVDENIRVFKDYINTFGGVANKSMYTSQYFFSVKYQIFREILFERDIPWRVKMLIIDEFEKLRYKYFGDMHGLGESVSFIELATKIQQNMNEQHWSRIGYNQKNQNSQKSFLIDLLRLILEGENATSFKRFLEINQVNINNETIPIIESLIKGILIKEKILPLLTKLDFDLKFQKIKRYLGFECSQSYLIYNIDNIQIEMQKWIQQNNKINKIDDQTSKKYEDLDYFFLLLSSVFEDICTYHLADSVYAQEILKVDLHLIQFQLKALKRVLIQTYITAGSSDSSKYLADINLLTSYMMKYFNDFKLF
ncbi:hypothetical protein TTHERM_00765360 (macronuclear) [Tetrahymena thermophila SB210]|uniref:Uncharacterized protein n=1 Tax=Tetrahymena thermophila (strain SB210) TaxID=312017 RepID=I7MML7_TETTS|nr:hypothetical protein TTHERM_00765360 [Tetrahymena thermophila SB210]EAS05150.1 hypothetical protein TTHERM_00765360 [Tetrahymena thermophila SB210]|eukprot:XP_001025395.1 hypothetical protein TTHERM_00765360 [Tetrahymena thermophila SB210]